MKIICGPAPPPLPPELPQLQSPGRQCEPFQIQAGADRFPGFVASASVTATDFAPVFVTTNSQAITSYGDTSWNDSRS